MPDQVNELMNYLRKLQSDVQEFIDCDELNEGVRIYLSGIRDKASTLHHVLEMNRPPQVVRQVCANTLTHRDPDRLYCASCGAEIGDATDPYADPDCRDCADKENQDEDVCRSDQ